MKRITVLGSTGSIGVSALDVIDNLGREYGVLGIASRANWRLTLEQAQQFRPEFVAVYDNTAAEMIKGRLPRGVKLLPPGIESVMELASHPKADLVVNGLAGGIGFGPLVAAVKAGKTIALANKEPMVMAGAALMRECRRWNAAIIPVDSEPSAVFQCLQHSGKLDSGEISRILLTASGGPFFKRRGSLSDVTPAQALNHPRWKMGPKITIDSATLMNKGFEAIEIQNLFSLPLSKIKVVVHPQSIVHSAVEFKDSSVLAQLSLPDMRLPIQYAITYPARAASPVRPVSILDITKLEFHEPDFSRFPCLKLALDCAAAGGSYPAVLSAADEVAVEAFLKGRLEFTGIARLVENVLSAHNSGGEPPTLAEAVEVDQWARDKAEELLAASNRGKMLKRAKRKQSCLHQ